MKRKVGTPVVPDKCNRKFSKTLDDHFLFEQYASHRNETQVSELITKEQLEEWKMEAERLQATLPCKEYDGTNGTHADVSSLTKFSVGMTCDRLAWVRREELLRAIEYGGIAKWDGDYSVWPSDRCSVWIRFELQSLGRKQITLLNHSTGDREYFTSISQAIRFIRDYY